MDQEYLEYLEDQWDAPSFESIPRGRRNTTTDPRARAVNNRMATLKRHEERLNRYRTSGIL
jgi:hypothetical protein